MKEITHVSEWSGGYHAYLKGEGPKKETIPVDDIRGAISAPASEKGYFLILGRQHNRAELKNQPLMLLSEGESMLQDELFEKVSDCQAKMQCNLFYTDRAKEGFYQALLNNFEDHKVDFDQAPFVAEPEYGEGLIREKLSKKLLKVPKESILYGELLNKMTPDSRGAAFDPLRFLLGGYLKFRPTRLVSVEQGEYFWG